MRLSVFASLLLLAASASAQTSRPSWASFGLGSSNGGRNGGLVGVSAQIYAPVGARSAVVQVGTTASGELFGRGDEVIEAHVALGAAARSGPLHVAVVAGPSVGRVALSRLDSLGRLDKTARFLPGVYGSVHGLVGLGPNVGVGVELYGQGNADLSTAGFRFMLSVGSL